MSGYCSSSRYWLRFGGKVDTGRCEMHSPLLAKHNGSKMRIVPSSSAQNTEVLTAADFGCEQHRTRA